jgi:hypothetical protein
MMWRADIYTPTALLDMHILPTINVQGVLKQKKKFT